MIGEALHGRYRIQRRLSEGGMGEVYLADDELLMRKVVVKRVLPALAARTDLQLARRLYNEARATASLCHRNVVQVYDFLLVDGDPWLVMELLVGESLAERLKREPCPPWPLVAGIARQLGDALDAAHAAGMIHRDVKPDNAFLVDNPEARSGATVKLIDFGLVKLHPLYEPGVKSAFGPHGTFAYAAPEQMLPPFRATAASDVYSLGCIAFEMLAGRLVYGENDGVAPRLATLVRGLPPRVDEIVARALSRDPLARPATAGELARALAELELPRPPRAKRPRLGELIGEGAWAYVFALADEPGAVAKVARARPTNGTDLAEHWWLVTTVTHDATFPPSEVLAREADWLHALPPAVADVFPRLVHGGTIEAFDVASSRREGFALERLDGVTLAELLRRDRAASARALPEVIRQAQRLAAAGLFHGDLKPENIMIDAQGRVRFLDPSAGFWTTYHALATPLRNPRFAESDVPALGFLILEALSPPRTRAEVPRRVPTLRAPEHTPFHRARPDLRAALAGWLARHELPSTRGPSGVALEELCFRCMGADGDPPSLADVHDDLLALLARQIA